MKSILRLAGCLLLLAIITTTAACNDDDDPNDQDADLKILARMEEDIDLYIGEADCLSDDDCRALPFGEKPCGGPWSYKVFSMAAVDSTVLADMIVRYNEFNQVLNDRYGWMSDCMYVGQPEVDCYKGKCVAVQEAAAKQNPQ